MMRDNGGTLARLSPGYHLVDIPFSLTPPSFTLWKPISSTPVTQPRNPPEPKKKDTQWPQAEDLKKLHERYGELVESALKSAHNDGVKKWCENRIKQREQTDDNDIRQWHEMFKVMDSFGNKEERAEISLSDTGSAIHYIY
jgi:hypothetical protein